MDRGKVLTTLSESDIVPYGIANDFAKQSIPHKVFLASYWVPSEIHQEGFLYYFASPAAEAAPFVLEALESIGAPQTAEIFKAAIEAVFPDGLPESAEAIQNRAKKLIEGSPDDTIEKLDHLEKKFFQHPEDLTELLFEYAKRHPDYFGDLSEVS